MTDLPVSPFMHTANTFLDGNGITLDAVIAEFQKLEEEDRRLHFGQLCQRKLQANEQLIGLLFAIGTILGCRRPKTFHQLEKDWRKRGKDTLPAKDMLAMLCEQFAP